MILSSTITAAYAVQPPDDFYSYEIEFIEWELIDDMNVKFTYRVKSGGKPSISHWELWSCCFSREDMIVDASETYELDTNKHMLKFDEGYEDYEERTVWFIIHIVDYTACGIGTIDFSVKGGQYLDEGLITGPSCTPDFYIPENPLGTLGAIIPLIAALGLVAATKKNWISIKVT